LSTRPQTQPRSTSRTTSSSGQQTTTAQPHTCSTPRATRPTASAARSSPPTSNTARRTPPPPPPPPLPPSRTYPPRRASASLSRSRTPCPRGVRRRMRCGRCGASSRRARTSWRTLPSPSSTILATLAAAWPRSIASSPFSARELFKGAFPARFSPDIFSSSANR